jgi:hypothetical protein
MSFGIALNNANGSAVVSTDVIGYEYHGKLTVGNRLAYYSGTSSTPGVREVYGLAGCHDFPLVFIADLGGIPEPGEDFFVADTQQMVSIHTIRPSTTSGYDWDIIVVRGYDRITDASHPLSLLIFKPVTQTPGGSYGMILKDSSGNTTFDSTRKMLMPRVFSTFTGTLSQNSVTFFAIDNYSSILSEFGITRPAFMYSGNILTRGFTPPFFNIYCVTYYGTLHSLYSGGIAVAHARIGHNVDGSNPDSCNEGSYPTGYGDLTSAGGLSVFIIDADLYD